MFFTVFTFDCVVEMVYLFNLFATQIQPLLLLLLLLLFCLFILLFFICSCLCCFFVCDGLDFLLTIIFCYCINSHDFDCFRLLLTVLCQVGGNILYCMYIYILLLVVAMAVVMLVYSPEQNS